MKLGRRSRSGAVAAVVCQGTAFEDTTLVSIKERTYREKDNHNTWDSFSRSSHC
jgi:hypothetical protein